MPLINPRALLPHAGAIVMLDGVVRWDGQEIVCLSRRHLDTANPLRRDGHLPAVAGAEFCLQAAALHGALLSDRAQPPGYVASLREVVLHTDRLDDPAFATLLVEAVREAQEAFGMIYRLHLRVENGPTLLTGRATVALSIETRPPMTPRYKQ